MSPTLRLHQVLERSVANGPGCRAVVWVQGCSLGCPGCYNPATHDPRLGTLFPVDELAARLVALEGVEGVTLTGGEPLQQATQVAALLQRLTQDSNLSVVLFTGYDESELAAQPWAVPVLALVDILVAGRYDPRHAVPGGFPPSSNQTVRCLTSRYDLAQLAAVPRSELLIHRDGRVETTGVDPVRW